MLKRLFLIVTILFSFIAMPAVSNAAQTHTVSSGDSLWKISVWYQVGLSEIIAANPHIKNPSMIYPGQRVTIPEVTEKSFENQVIQLTNKERAKHGLQPLKANWELSRVARYKSADMRDKNYFSHTSPTYGSPFDMMKNFGVSYRTAGENIAAGQTTPQQVVQAWMNSEGHRKNILSSNYNQIGVGYAEGGSQRHYWTQMFISK